MSGHNKWSKIKRAKEIKDKAKGNVFSKMSKLITLAVIEGGGITDQNNNLKLRMAIDKAKQFNMPKNNIERAIANGLGADKNQLKEINYEIFAPGGVAIIVHATTDNQNRTLSEIRNIAEKHHAKLGNQGSVAYLFTKCGIVNYSLSDKKEEDILALAEGFDAFDFDKDEDNYTVYFPFENLGKVQNAEIDYKPNSTVLIEDKTIADKIISLIDALENHNDVHGVYTNMSLHDDLAAKHILHV